MTMMNLQFALDSAPEPPCVRFACPERSKCAEQLLACDAFLAFVESGRSVSPFMASQGPRSKMQMGTVIVATRSKFQAVQEA